MERACGLRPLLHDEITAIRSYFSTIEQDIQIILWDFFDLLKSHYPEVAGLLSEACEDACRRRLSKGLNEVIWSLDQGARLQRILSDYGRFLTDLGFKREHFCAAGECFLNAIAQIGGRSWTTKTCDQWTKMLELCMLLMLKGAARSPRASTGLQSSVLVGRNQNLPRKAVSRPPRRFRARNDGTLKPG